MPLLAWPLCMLAFAAAVVTAALQSTGTDDAPYYLYPPPMREHAWAQQYIMTADVGPQRYSYSGNMWNIPANDGSGSMVSKQSVDDGGVAFCGTIQPQTHSYPQASVSAGKCNFEFNEVFNCTDWSLDSTNIWHNSCVFQRIGSTWTAKMSTMIAARPQDASLPASMNSTLVMGGAVSIVTTMFVGPSYVPPPTYANCTGFC